METKTIIIPEETSKRITSLRYILIVLVVFIHAYLSSDDALNYYKLDFIQPKWIGFIKDFIKGTLASAAVPLFYLFASYLQFSKNDTYGELLKKRSKSIFLPYILWTIISIVLFFVAQSNSLSAPYFQNPINIIKNWKFIDYLKAFTYHDGMYPLVYQFWFLRELIVFILLTPVFKFFLGKAPGFFIILIASFLLINTSLYFTCLASALFFYSMGYYFATYKINFFTIADKLNYIEYILLFVLSSVFDYIFEGKYAWGFIITIISCLFWLKVSKFLISKESLFNKLKYLSGYSFFLYAAHQPFLETAINKLTMKFIPLHGILCLVQYFIAALLTIIIGTVTGIILDKVFPSLFRLLNGGRKY